MEIKFWRRQKIKVNVERFTNQIMMVTEFKFIVACELISVARVLVLLVPIIAIPVVFLHRSRSIVNVISWPFETFKRSF